MNTLELKQSAQTELHSILAYWEKNAIDHQHGGFVGQIDFTETIHPSAMKGAVLNARILWSFSAAFNLTKADNYLKLADRAFEYLKANFIDKTYGGVYWTVDQSGQPGETKKQIYAQAFALYAFSEYFKATNRTDALQMAKDLFALIEQYSFDKIEDGYFEAFTREWTLIGDLRLSDKDANEKKTMNTHLHVLEAYANLYTIWPDETLRLKIHGLLDIFQYRILDQGNWHLGLFFDEHWTRKDDHISYGHDIEASWLMQEAAAITGDHLLTNKFEKIAVRIANASLEGVDKDGGMWYEYLQHEKRMIREKHWWPQAEAVVGFINAWQHSGQIKYYDAAIRCWKFIFHYIKDQKNGEWYWGVKDDYSIMQEDKAGLWKCPYHNSRACMELIRRLTPIGR
ncbi:MAG: N-acyl-D-glucosamine 2-epimerase [Citrobacter freundii]|nr:MAG: N-acyl-D-glucosamine 2-epimerase [Citrobacter freundii]